MEAHIFQLKDDVPASAGGGHHVAVDGQSTKRPYLPYYGNILNTYQAYQELGDHYNDRSWYWTISRINDLVAKYPDLFEDGAIRTEMERLESQ
ncbi:MAG: C69 family dipeptidase [Streptococcus sp.]